MKYIYILYILYIIILYYNYIIYIYTLETLYQLYCDCILKRKSISCMNHGRFIGYNTAAKMNGPEFFITAQMNYLRKVSLRDSASRSPLENLIAFSANIYLEKEYLHVIRHKEMAEGK